MLWAWIRAQLPVRIALDALLLSLLTAAVFAVAFHGFVRMFTQPRTEAVVGYVAAELGGLAEAYERLPEADRSAFLDAVAAGSRGRLLLDDLAAWGRSAPGDTMDGEGIVADLIKQLRERFPVGRVAMTRSESGLHLWFALSAPGGALRWVRIPIATDQAHWSTVSITALCLLMVAGIGGSIYLALRLRHRVDGIHRTLQRLRPDALRRDAPQWARTRRADPAPSGRDADDPQAHLDALAGRLAQAARERATLANAVAGDLRHGLVRLAGSEPLLAATEAATCARRVESVVQQLGRLAGSAGEVAAPGGGHRQRPREGLLADIAMVASLFSLVIALSAVAVVQGVFLTRVRGGFDVALTVVSGIHATHAALPPADQEGYLRTLQGYSGGSLRVDDPARWPIAEPHLWIFREGVERLRAAFPDLVFLTTPIPRTALWVRLVQADGRAQWLHLTVPVLQSWQAPVLAALALLSLAVAAVVALQARRRLAWFSRTIEVADPGAPVLQPYGLDREPDTGLLGMLRDMQHAAGALAREHDREELALAQLSDELGQSLDALRAAIPHAAEAAATADQLAAMRKRVAELDGFARRRQSVNNPAADVNAQLRELRLHLVERGGPPVLWVPGGVPLADIPPPELRRLFLYLLDEVERHGDAPIVVSTQLLASHVVLDITGHKHSPASVPAPGDEVGLAVVRRILAANAGVLQLATLPEGGLQAQVWLRPARVG